MKKKINILLLTVAFIPILFGQQNNARLWTETDRQFLLDGLKSTQRELMKEVEDLNEVQLLFKPDTSKWSISEILEHLGTFEEILAWDIYCNQYTPEQSGFTKNHSAKDSLMLAYATDTTKGKSPSVAAPLGRFTSLVKLKKYFEYNRAEVIRLVKNSTSDFRKHYIYRPSEWGEWAVRDLHQYVLIYITHTTRHTNQIRKVKSDKNFPSSGKFWTERDREILLNEFERTKKELILETESLTNEQWHFKPSKDAWSIAQVVEHLGLYERIFLQEAWIATELPPQPEYHVHTLTDSTYLSWMAERQSHVAPDNAIPLGYMKGKDNLHFFTFGRDHIIDFVSKTTKDLRVHFTPREGEPNNRRSIHGLLTVHYGHTDRHLRQISRIKSNENYPK
ncbi:MAG: DinB family protein [Saprospiraceae bacterium]|nr:DinB family protein [Saprospiraceae bacterium]MBP6566669.1 DinB family protein [Saprospiraceae bacterium]